METETKSNWVVQGGGKLEVGKEYEVRHSRKGTFRMRIDSVSGEWASGEITHGTANAMMNHNVKDKGESITVRDVLCYFIPVTN